MPSEHRGYEPDTILAEALDTAGQHHRRAMPMTVPARDVLSPREVADRSGFSYHAILRAIRRGDIQAFEPVPGHYRIELSEYERWLHRPMRGNITPAEPRQRPRRPTA